MQSVTMTAFSKIFSYYPTIIITPPPNLIFRQSLIVAMWKKVSDLVAQNLELVPVLSVSLKSTCSNHVLR